MNKDHEKGFALPMVIAILMILIFMSFFLFSGLLRHRQSIGLFQEMMEAQYVAESGIALMQRRLQENPGWTKKMFYHYGHYYVTTQVIQKGDQWIELKSQAIGKQGVRKTIRVKLDPKTLAIRQWLK